MEMTIKLKDINKYRKELMGFAALLVIAVHIYGSEYWPQWAQNIHRFCQNGVDIFLFLSGIGCYYSVSKNTTFHFYCHRVLRIMIPYLIVLMLCAPIQILYWGYTLSDFYYSNGLTTFFIYGFTRTWFLSAIIVLYLVTPLLYKLFQKHEVGYWVTFAVCLIAASKLEYYFATTVALENIFMLFISRIPIYLLGFGLANRIKENGDKEIKLTSKLSILLSCAVIAGFFFNSFFNKINCMQACHLISVVLAPIICAWLCAIFNYYRPKCLSILGTITLEMYLLNERISNFLYNSFQISYPTIFICSFILTVFVSLIIQKILNKSLT